MTNIAVIGNAGENYDDLKPTITNDENTEKTTEMVKEKQIVINDTDNIKSQTSSATPLAIGNNSISPRAKKLANKKGLNISNLVGSGPMGRIIERDIIKAGKSGAPLTPIARDISLNSTTTIPSNGSGIGGRITSQDILSKSNTTLAENVIREEPIKGVRKLISERMLESLQNSAQLTLNSSADAANLLVLRETFKNSKLDSRFAKTNINDLIMYALVKVLPNHPIINSLMQDNKIKYYQNIHLGFAVDTPRGLMVPTIKNAQNLSLTALSDEIKRLAYACRDNKIQVDELSGATFTITNLGNFGIDDFTPVLNLPQTAILGLGRINLKAVQVGNEVKFIPHIGLSLTINHQVIDGAVGAKFLQDLAAAIKEINLLVAL
jgi:pyruvate dehydrogenase E2 component (dihydrolipoamide acetyltransferase)